MSILIVCCSIFALLYLWITPFSSPGPINVAANKGGARADIVTYKMNNLRATSRPIENREKVLILTPLARFYPEYWENLVNLDFPHSLIELGFIVPKNSQGDQALKALNKAVNLYQKTGDTELSKESKRTKNAREKFARITILRQDTASLDSHNEKDRHAKAVQKKRRAQMSLARNSLLSTTIRPDTAWVLWLDSDIVESPATLIQDLAAHDKPLIVANCFQRYVDKEKGKSIRPYDFNSWQDSDIAKDLASKMSEDDILLEGYSDMATYRTLMAMLYDEAGDKHAEIPLDGVGGTALLVKGDVHRDGATFPPFPFYHLIETEGFAKMAKRLGYQAYGLPNYLVYHYNE